MNAIKKICISIVLVIIATSAAYAVCDFDETTFETIDGLSVREVPIVQRLFGKQAIAELQITDIDRSILYELRDHTIRVVESETPQYIVTTTSCTIEKLINQEMSLITAYTNKDITVTGIGVGARTRVLIGNIVTRIISWFQ